LTQSNGTANFLTTYTPGVVCTGVTTNYTDASIEMLSFNYTYGTITFRGLFPSKDVNGNPSSVHSGVWLLGAVCQGHEYWDQGDSSECPQYWGGGPNNLEIDIEESYGLDYTSATLHTEPVTPFPSPVTFNYDTDMNQWHVWTLRWTSTNLDFYMDGSGTPYFSVNPTTFPSYPVPTSPMFLQIWMDINTYAPNGSARTSLAQMDYVRWCSSPTAVCAPGDPTMIFEDEFGGPIPVATTMRTGKTAVSGNVSVH
jgi:hypothetical protein